MAPLTLRQFSVTLPEETEAPSAGDCSSTLLLEGQTGTRLLFENGGCIHKATSPKQFPARQSLEASQAGMASTNQKYVPGGSVGGENCVVDELAKTGGLLLLPR